MVSSLVYCMSSHFSIMWLNGNFLYLYIVHHPSFLAQKRFPFDLNWFPIWFRPQQIIWICTVQDLIYSLCTLMERCFFGRFFWSKFWQDQTTPESSGLKTGSILHFNFIICINHGCQITSGCFRRARYSSFINLLKILLKASGGQQTKDVYVAGYLLLFNGTLI